MQEDDFRQGNAEACKIAKLSNWTKKRVQYFRTKKRSENRVKMNEGVKKTESNATFFKKHAKNAY